MIIEYRFLSKRLFSIFYINVHYRYVNEIENGNYDNIAVFFPALPDAIVK